MSELPGIMLCEHGWYQCETCVGARVEGHLKLLREGQMNLCSAMDLLSQGQARLAARLDEIAELLPSEAQVRKLDAKLMATGDGLADAMAHNAVGCAAAISDLRESGMRNHQQIRHELAALLDALGAKGWAVAELLDTPRGRGKHGYRGKKTTKRS
jgi:hypothetical protein